MASDGLYFTFNTLFVVVTLLGRGIGVFKSIQIWRYVIIILKFVFSKTTVFRSISEIQ